MDEFQFLTFYIEKEIFALDLLQIQEIIPYDHITYIPKMQPYILGVMNIRGKIIPIVSLNKRLDLNLPMDSKKRSIIIISLQYEDERLDIGVVVSKVDKVYTLQADKIEPAPTFGTTIKKEFIKNIASFDDQFISILNVDEVLNIDHLSKTTQEI
jgi:purine-binding chemotaxis protein CheW